MRQGVQADERRDEGYAVDEVGRVEGHAQIAGKRVHADHGDEHAEQRRDAALEQRTFGQRRHNGQAEDAEGEIFRGAEVEGEVCELGGDRGQHKAGEDAADEGGDGGHFERLERFPAGGELRPFEHGRGGGRRARSADEDGGDAARVDGPAVHAEQGGKGDDGGEAEGQGNEQGHAHDGGEAGQRAEDDAERHADEVGDEGFQTTGRTEGCHEHIEHGVPPF